MFNKSDWLLVASFRRFVSSNIVYAFEQDYE